MNRRIIVVGALVLAIALLAVLSRSQNEPKEKTKHYESSSIGIAFDYPNNYFLEVKDTGSPQRKRTAIILTEDTEENRLVREGKTPPREGPVAITVDIFQNSEKLSAEGWVRGMSYSNFKLSSDEPTIFTYKDRDAVSYRWSGLYEGQSVVFAHKENIVMLSVTFIAPSDSIITVFEDMLESVELK